MLTYWRLETSPNIEHLYLAGCTTTSMIGYSSVGAGPTILTFLAATRSIAVSSVIPGTYDDHITKAQAIW